MSFEQIIRPFQSRPVTATKRVIRSVIASPTEPLTATLIWGAAGAVVEGEKQVEGVDLEAVGFTVNRCNEDWKQKGAPETEDVSIPISATSSDGAAITGEATMSRVKKIRFTRKRAENPPSNAYVAAGVSEVLAGLRADIPGSDACDHSYTFKW